MSMTVFDLGKQQLSNLKSPLKVHSLASSVASTADEICKFALKLFIILSTAGFQSNEKFQQQSLLLSQHGWHIITLQQRFCKILSMQHTWEKLSFQVCAKHGRKINHAFLHLTKYFWCINVTKQQDHTEKKLRSDRYYKVFLTGYKPYSPGREQQPQPIQPRWLTSDAGFVEFL